LRVAALGWRPVVAPLLEIIRLPVTLPASDAIQAILVTSSSAVPNLPEALHPLPLLAVGDATADRARAAGFAEVYSAGADAVALAALASRKCDFKGLPLLLASGRGQGLELAAELRTRGFRVTRHTVYASTSVRRLPDEVRAALWQRELHAALFFSAATAGQFAQLLVRGHLRETVADVEACAIGAATAAAIEDLPWRRVRCAAQPTQDAMLALLS
jgi:uroporphyrinogen-III synthase